jgi:hypothetical protein
MAELKSSHTRIVRWLLKLRKEVTVRKRRQRVPIQISDKVAHFTDRVNFLQRQMIRNARFPAMHLGAA